MAVARSDYRLIFSASHNLVGGNRGSRYSVLLRDSEEMVSNTHACIVLARDKLVLPPIGGNKIGLDGIESCAGKATTRNQNSRKRKSTGLVCVR